MNSKKQTPKHDQGSGPLVEEIKPENSAISEPTPEVVGVDSGSKALSENTIRMTKELLTKEFTIHRERLWRNLWVTGIQHGQFPHSRPGKEHCHHVPGAS